MIARGYAMGLFLRFAAWVFLIAAGVTGPAAAAAPAQAAAATASAGTADHHPHRLLTMLGITIGAALALIMVFAILGLLRATRRLILGRELKHEKTPYVDAWKLAGKRLRPPEENRGDDLSDSPDP